MDASSMDWPILSTTTVSVEGQRVKEYKGIVRGIVVRTPTLSQGFVGGVKTLLGGNIEEFAEMCEQAREDAFHRMILHARQMGANAVIGMHYDASGIGQGAEVLCYGTAVVLEPAPGAAQ